MSQHIVVREEKKFVFGWDQPLQSYYLQVHDTTRDEDDQIIVWLGATPETKMYGVDRLVTAAAKNGLLLDHPTRMALYREKDEGV
jgi:hypothetical protein